VLLVLLVLLRLLLLVRLLLLELQLLLLVLLLQLLLLELLRLELQLLLLLLLELLLLLLLELLLLEPLLLFQTRIGQKRVVSCVDALKDGSPTLNPTCVQLLHKRSGAALVCLQFRHRQPQSARRLRRPFPSELKVLAAAHLWLPLVLQLLRLSFRPSKAA
jgi:hypothetical protein